MSDIPQQPDEVPPLDTPGPHAHLAFRLKAGRAGSG